MKHFFLYFKNSHRLSIRHLRPKLLHVSLLLLPSQPAVQTMLLTTVESETCLNVRLDPPRHKLAPHNDLESEDIAEYAPHLKAFQSSYYYTSASIIQHEYFKHYPRQLLVGSFIQHVHRINGNWKQIPSIPCSWDQIKTNPACAILHNIFLLYIYEHQLQNSRHWSSPTTPIHRSGTRIKLWKLPFFAKDQCNDNSTSNNIPVSWQNIWQTVVGPGEDCLSPAQSILVLFSSQYLSNLSLQNCHTATLSLLDALLERIARIFLFSTDAFSFLASHSPYYLSTCTGGCGLPVYGAYRTWHFQCIANLFLTG